VISAGSYILSVALLVVLVLSLGFSAVRLRQRFLPNWEGAPGHLVEAVVGVALLIWIAELLGVVNLLYAWTLVVSALLLAVAIAVGPREASLPGGGAVLGDRPEEQPHRRGGGTKTATGPTGLTAMSLVAVAVVVLVFAHWGLTTADALSRGIFNFDSLWYHMPFAVEMAQSHSVTGLHYTETVFTNWFYPQNSELLHAVGILLTHRDTLSLFLNFGWLAMAFLAAWCIGRPYGRGPLTVVAAGILLECHTLVVREPGAAKNDLMAAALLLAAVAILVNANWGARLPRVARGGVPGGKRRPLFRPKSNFGREETPLAKNPAPRRAPHPATGPAAEMLPLAIAGLATGMAVGTKSTALAMAAALTVAIVVLAPVGRRWAAAGWWFAAGLAGGGYWYLRNLVISGNPLPQVESLGPISLPHPERLQSGRPDFSIAHYATDTSIWQEYFGPELHEAFGLLWPLVILAAIAGGVVALLWGRTRVLRWMGGVALFGMLAYLFTPLSAAGPEGAPEGFGINLRYAVPALLAGLTLLPLVDLSGVNRRYRWSTAGTWGWVLLGALLLVLGVTNRSDAVLRDPDRLFGGALALLLVLIPAALLFARSRGTSRGVVAGGFVALVIAVLAIGYPLQRDYLDDRFANANAATSIPDMDLDSAYRWARDVHDSRIGLAGTTAGFLQYGFYGTDLSNRIRYIGAEGPHGAFNAISTCTEFRTAVNEAELDYLVTAPLLNFIEPTQPVSSPEAGWLRGEPAVVPIDSSGPVTVWRVDGRLDPDACGPANAPLYAIPQQPGEMPTAVEPGPILASREAIVIFGDSFSAGEGADEYLPGTDTADNPCHRSAHTYLTDALGIPGERIVACSGAVAADVQRPQPERTVEPQAAQLRAIRERSGVDAVILTLGGNDAGFADIGASCLIGGGSCARHIFTDPSRHFRKEESGAFVEDRIGALPAKLRAAYLSIDHEVNGTGAHSEGKAVPILVLGYPIPTPVEPECERMEPLLQPDEVLFLNGLAQRLNATIATTVAEVRKEQGVPIFYVPDTAGAFRPHHTICGPRPYVRTPWSFDGAGRESAQLDPTRAFWRRFSDAFKPLRVVIGEVGRRAASRWFRLGVRELIHPNQAGYAAMSRAVLLWSQGAAAAEAFAFLQRASVAEPPR
jgi:lysophospholipase L1-like esterase